MRGNLKAFEIKVNGKILDYRLGENLDLEAVKAFFAKKYTVKKLWYGGRHVLGILVKDDKELFLKLATSEGIGEITKVEYKWNEEFNNLLPRRTTDFYVPQNQDSGMYNDNLFFLITDILQGEMLANRPEKTTASRVLQKYLPRVIDFSEAIQNLKINKLSGREDSPFHDLFLTKTKSWFESIPQEITARHNLDKLLEIIEGGTLLLEKRPRHGDFTPWHLIKLDSGKLGLIDGEHALANGVEYYDIGYFSQRVFCVLENPGLAQSILNLLLQRKYDMDKIRIILLARVIGGFLDESLKDRPNYLLHDSFKNWTINLR